MIRDEFIFSQDGENFHSLKELLDFYDNLISENDRRFWEDVQRGYIMVFVQKPKAYSSEPEPVQIARMPIEDAVKKFG